MNELFGSEYDPVPFMNALTGLCYAIPGVVAAVVSVITLRQSQRNGVVAAQVITQGRDNAEAIEHTRKQNINIATAVHETNIQNTEMKVQNDNIATAVSHVHICVETKASELKDVVERAIPEAIKEAVPVAIQEVVPAAIKETLVSDGTFSQSTR